MFTIIACVAVVGVSYWTDRLSDKETVGRPSVFDDDLVRQSVVFASPRLEIDRMGASCDPCHARHHCGQDTLIPTSAVELRGSHIKARRHLPWQSLRPGMLLLYSLKPHRLYRFRIGDHYGKDKSIRDDR
jgi:hypothetical protein